MLSLMEQQDGDILKDFETESISLIEGMLQILEDCEDNFKQVKRLEEYGQTVDRIMGGAQNLAVLMSDDKHIIHKIADYAAVCKAVGYKASQIKDNDGFYNICVGLLLDATENLREMIEVVNDETAHKKVEKIILPQIIDRVKWVSSQFSSDYAASVDVKTSAGAKLGQEDIDALLKKLGF